MRRIIFLVSFTLMPLFPLFARQVDDQLLHERARRLAQEFIIVDGHVDIPYRLKNRWEDISQRTERGDFDYVRAKEGGLNAPFMSIYIPAEREEQKTARQLADSLIDMVEGFAKTWPDKFAIARTVADVRAHFKRGIISLPMGMENGAPLEGKLENVRYFYNRGIRYITLAHSRSNHLADASFDTVRLWKGLSPFGKQVVAEMNRLGIMIDLSHLSDDAARQVLEMSKAPVIASHSSCRAFTPQWERNMPDEIISLLGRNGGVIMINFGSSFLSDDYRKKEEAARPELMAYMRANNIRFGDPRMMEFISDYRRRNNIAFADVSDVVNHIDHVVKLVGVDHVGFGSDFDGVGDSLPTGLKDVSYYPNIIFHLLKRGYSESDIKKICGENLLRVWSKVEEVAKQLQGQK
jgi:membrane dipeptidase